MVAWTSPSPSSTRSFLIPSKIFPTPRLFVYSPNPCACSACVVCCVVCVVSSWRRGKGLGRVHTKVSQGVRRLTLPLVKLSDKASGCRHSSPTTPSLSSSVILFILLSPFLVWTGLGSVVGRGSKKKKGENPPQNKEREQLWLFVVPTALLPIPGTASRSTKGSTTGGKLDPRDRHGYR